MYTLFSIVFVSLFRVLPHAPNFAPVGGLAILSGREQSKKQALISIVASLLVSDFLLAQIYGYAFLSLTSLFVYAAFALHTVLGSSLKNLRFGGMAAAILGAVSFYLITNFGVWATSGMYSKDIHGLFTCYAAAIPFFKMTLLSNLVWTPSLIVAHKFVQKYSATNLAAKQSA